MTNYHKLGDVSNINLFVVLEARNLESGEVSAGP